jgi:poly(A) polymerase
VGEAYRFLLELRLEEGPLGAEAATERLRGWHESKLAAQRPGDADRAD